MQTPPGDAVGSVEAAEMLGIGESQLHRLVRCGGLPADGTFGGRDTGARRHAAFSLPPDGIYRGPRWWAPDRFNPSG